MNILESQWRIYRDACYPPKAGKLDTRQESETRQAFYAGCIVALKFATESAQGMPEEQAYRYIIGLIQEAQSVCSDRIYEMKGYN